MLFSLNSTNMLFWYFRVQYSDGKPLHPPKPCAGNKGTQILVGVYVLFNYIRFLEFDLKLENY